MPTRQRKPPRHHFRRKPRWRRWGVRLPVALVIVALVIFAGGVTNGGDAGVHRHTRPSADRPARLQGGPARKILRTSKPKRTRTKPARTWLGPYGVESSAIIAQNRLPGTTAWQISGAPSKGFIEGFATTTYAAPGQQVGLYISTTAPQYRVVAYRMGYYQGDGARQVWSSQEQPGHVQPSCPVTPGTNMVSCDNWSRSLTVTITRSFMQGDYLFKLTGSGNQQSYIQLTVWNPNSHAAYLVMSHTLTEEGWNTFGGYSFYQGNGSCTLGQTSSYPPCNRARIVSFDRPYASGNGSSDFLSNEYPLVRFIEKHGLDAAYVTDITIRNHPSIVLNHKAVLSLGHDEIWSYRQRQAVQNGLSHGINVVFFGAAAVLRHCRLQPSPLNPDGEEVDYRDPTEDPLNGKGSPMEVTGNTWGSPPTNWSEVPFTGELYSGYTLPGVAPLPFVVADASAWIFKGTGLKNGASIPRVIVSDFDHLALSQGSPSNIQVLGHSPIPLSDVYTNQGQWGSYTYSDMTYYTTPSGGGVLDTGTVNWIYSLSPCPPSGPSCPAPLVGKITGNLLWLFGQGPAGKLIPSDSNWRQITPSGS